MCCVVLCCKRNVNVICLPTEHQGAHKNSCACACIPLEMLAVEERGKPEYWRKTSRSRVENRQQTQSTYERRVPESNPGHNWWKASALTTAPSLLPALCYM